MVADDGRLSSRVAVLFAVGPVLWSARTSDLSRAVAAGDEEDFVSRLRAWWSL
jgi:hypothetical protein